MKHEPVEVESLATTTSTVLIEPEPLLDQLRKEAMDLMINNYQQTSAIQTHPEVYRAMLMMLERQKYMNPTAWADSKAPSMKSMTLNFGNGAVHIVSDPNCAPNQFMFVTSKGYHLFKVGVDVPSLMMSSRIDKPLFSERRKKEQEEQESFLKDLKKL